MHLTHSTSLQSSSIVLPSSKSESNRLLIIQALSQEKFEIHNLSEARDTVTLQKLLTSPDKILDVIDAGTTMRFLTALCVAQNQKKILTGSKRMCERPLGILVDALRELGASIDYLQENGFPPIEIKDFVQQKNEISIRGDVSSQYISALLMIAPILPHGLVLHLLPPIHSQPYIDMTLQLLRQFGIQIHLQNQSIHIPSQSYKPHQVWVEADWSAASYWYAVVALCPSLRLYLEGVQENSLQGDRAIVDIMKKLGVNSEFDAKGAWIYHQPQEMADFEYDFSHQPDLAQTVAVVCAAQHRKAHLKGLQSLRLKETDRILALQNELQKFGSRVESSAEELLIMPSILHAPTQRIATYHDHRMAMAFAPMSLLFTIEIENPEVVQKSYPHFWKEWAKVVGNFKVV